MFRRQAVLRILRNKSTFTTIVRSLRPEHSKSKNHWEELYAEGQQSKCPPGEVFSIYLTESNAGKGIRVTEEDLRRCIRRSLQKRNAALLRDRIDLATAITKSLLKGIQLFLLRNPNKQLGKGTIELATRVMGTNHLPEIISFYSSVVAANSTSSKPLPLPSVISDHLCSALLLSMSKSNKRSSYAMVGLLLQFAKHKFPFSSKFCAPLLHDCMKRGDSQGAKYWWKLFLQHPDAGRDVAFSYYIRSLQFNEAKEEFEQSDKRIPINARYYQHFLLRARTVHEVATIYDMIPRDMRTISVANARIMSMAFIILDPAAILNLLLTTPRMSEPQMAPVSLLSLGVSILFRFQGPEEWLNSNEEVPEDVLTHWKALLKKSRPEWHVAVLDVMIQKRYPTDFIKDATTRSILEKDPNVQKARCHLTGAQFTGSLNFIEYGYHHSSLSKLRIWLGFTQRHFDFGGVGAKRLHQMYLDNLRSSKPRPETPPAVSAPSSGEVFEREHWVGPPVQDHELYLKNEYPTTPQSDVNSPIPPPPVTRTTSDQRPSKPQQRPPPPVMIRNITSDRQSAKPQHVPEAPVVRSPVRKPHKNVPPIPPEMEPLKVEGDIAENPVIRKFLRQREYCIRSGFETAPMLKAYTTAFSALTENVNLSKYLLRQFQADSLKGLKADSIFYTSLLQYLQRVNDYKGVIVVWNRIKEQSIQVDAKLLTVLLYACTAAAPADVSTWSKVAFEIWTYTTIKGFRLYTRFMHFLSVVGDVVEAEKLLLSAPRVPSLGGKLCPYLIDHLEATYARRKLSHAESVRRLKHLLIYKKPLPF
eukprot:TRINITY_DN19493_c0_g1_i1.p1 TRINITY_DN19493_c0_g1~~TRINITY_DN19493_c0_g1_i1.p1  ORF type:complete len:813 (+),score=94.18 TRINITY_DN19493_c0_g1_i1:70-2508(+)